MPRGGRRSGAPGAAYQNRSDLTASPQPLPVTTAPGQPYGAAGAQAAAQAQVPMAAGPPLPSPGASPTPPGAPGAVAPPPGPVAGSAPPLIRPTERPNEPVTSGVPVGAGPNTLDLPGVAPQTLGDLLTRLSATNPDLAYLAGIANGGTR